MPRAWIFQCNPRRYSLLDVIAEGVQISDWAVNQHRDEIRKDDRIFFRITNPRGGIYATGTVLSNPYPAQDEFGDYKVKIRCDALIDPPILRDETDNHPVLGSFLPLRGRQATNFPVPSDVSRALDRLISAPSRVARPITKGSKIVHTRPVRAVVPKDKNRSKRDQQRIEKIEKAAISYAMDFMWRNGYDFKHDAQRDKCGYDLVFRKGRSDIHLEVKGISGHKREFNLTRKEFRCASNDSNWQILVVTNALKSPKHLLLTGRELKRRLKRLEPQQYRCEL